MRIKKKGLALWLALFLGVSSLSGCGGGDDGMTQLSEKGAEILNSTEEDSDTDVEPLKQKTKLPEDGIITQAQMETIAGKDEKYYFTGKTDSGISYKWTYNGSQIQNPVEQKLLVQCSEDGTEEVKKLANDAPYALKVTLEKMNLAAPAKLTLNLKEKWDADKVLYCLEEEGKLYQLDTAKITTRETGKKKTERTTLTFNVTKTGGDFYLIGGSTTGESTDESDDKSKGTADNKDTQNGENSTGSSGGQSSTDGNTSSGQTDSSGDGTGNTDTFGGDDSSDTAMTCTFSIECSTILNNWDDLKESKAEFVPADGWILYPSEVEFYEGETVFDVLKRVCNQAGIQMESEWTPMYNSYYVSGINNLYEFDCGKDSGWMYCVNGWYPNYGCSKYTLEDGDTVEWRYTCNLGRDVGISIMTDAFSRCHPVLNFFYFAVVLGFTMFIQHPVYLAVSFVAATAYSMWLNGVKKVLKINFLLTLPSLLIVALLNPMFNHYGVTPLLYIESSGNWVTLEAMVYGIVLGCVLFIMILWFSCYNQIMTSDKFIYLFGRIIPAMSLMLSMALRFVPHFMAQLKVIRNGQKCVGMDVSNGKWFKKIRYALNMVSILVTWALENAIETADSMKSRGYGLRGRTAFSIYRFNRRDKLLGTMLVGLCVIFGYGCYRGAAFAQYNPRILLAGFTVFGRVPKQSCSPLLAAVTFVSFGVFCFLPLILDLCEESAMKKSRSHVQGEMAVTYRKIYEDMEGEAR